MTTVCGTPQYVAPEVIQATPGLMYGPQVRPPPLARRPLLRSETRDCWGWPHARRALARSCHVHKPARAARAHTCTLTPPSSHRQVDMWSAGVVLFVLLGGYPPFYSDHEPTLFDAIRRGAFSFDDPVWDRVSSGCGP